MKYVNIMKTTDVSMHFHASVYIYENAVVSWFCLNTLFPHVQ